MGEITENAAIEQIALVARKCGYHQIESEPKIRGIGFRPDLVAEHGGENVVIECQARPIMLSDVLQVSEYGLGPNTGKILCTGDDAFQRTPVSVKSYAKQLNIQLCDLNKIGKELQPLFV